ncbi:MAG: hypothetical protein KDE31_30185, partial [Caldilineaceae bacterium]|nr:hypothetical protein [Caldilineaceae bacterium]
MPNLLVSGTVDSRAERVDERLAADGLTVTVRKAIAVGTSRGHQQESLPLDRDDDLVEIEYGDGTVEWMRVDKLRERLAAQGIARSTTGDLTLPSQLMVEGAATRGIGALVIKGIKLLTLTVSGQQVRAVNEIIDAFESKLAPGPGLYKL